MAKRRNYEGVVKAHKLPFSIILIWKRTISPFAVINGLSVIIPNTMPKSLKAIQAKVKV